MGYAIIATIISAELCIKKESDKLVKSDWPMAIALIKGAIIGVLIWLTIGSVIGVNLPTIKTTTEIPILAFSNSDFIEGEIYLRSKYIKEKPVYEYVIETKKGKRIKTIDADEALIIKTDDSPMIVTEKTGFAKEQFEWFALYPFDSKTIKIYIPKDSIIADLNINLQ